MSGEESRVDRVSRSPPGARVLEDAEPRITVPGAPLTSTATIVSRWFGSARKPKYEYRPPTEAVALPAILIPLRADSAPAPRWSPRRSPPDPHRRAPAQPATP